MRWPGPVLCGFFLLTLISCQSMVPRYHVVQAGETFDQIAERYDLDPLELMRANRMTNPNQIFEGQELYLPHRLKAGFHDQAVDAPDPESSQVVSGPIAFQWPTREPRVTNYFGWRGRRRLHEGIDLAAFKGTPIYAAAKGEVIYVGRKRGYGNLVIIDHGQDWYTLYGHLSRFSVKVGQLVEPGQQLGAAGRTGRASGSHLHFEVRRGPDPIDPLSVLPRL